jgi:hypothetical protein
MVLCKVKLELAQVKQLTVGETLHLPHNTFPDTDIMTEAGEVIGSGALGQVNGRRALGLKRSPVHMTQPHRRETDLAKLDLPEITALPKPGNIEMKGSPAPTVETSVVDTGADLSVLNDAAAETENMGDSLESLEKLKTSQKGGRLEEIVLPELDDFPDLADMTHAS